MIKRSTQATLMTLLTAALVLPTSGLARHPQQSSGSSPSVQEERCFVKVEITNPKAKKDVSNNDVSCNKIRWGTTGATSPNVTKSATIATYTLSKKDCVDDRGRFGKIQLQKDKKSGQSSRTCSVQQFARGTVTPSQNQQK